MLLFSLQVQMERIRQADSLERIRAILNGTNLTDISQLPETWCHFLLNMHRNTRAHTHTTWTPDLQPDSIKRNRIERGRLDPAGHGEHYWFLLLLSSLSMPSREHQDSRLDLSEGFVSYNAVLHCGCCEELLVFQQTLLLFLIQFRKWENGSVKIK